MIMHLINDAGAKNDTMVLSTTMIRPDGKIRKLKFDREGRLSGVSFISFLSNGSIAKEEVMSDTSSSSKINKVRYSYFEGGRMIKGTVRAQRGDSARTDYFYSVHNFLDSVVTRENGKITGKKMFTSNEKHYILSMVDLSDRGDTLDVYSYQYKYDQQGNWIERRERHDKSKTPYLTYNAFPDHNITLTIREIIYPGNKQKAD